MKNNLMFIGTIMGAAAAAYLVSLYMKDDEIHQKVDRSIADIKNLAAALRQRLGDKRAEQAVREQEDIARNQQWADQQWEALGI